MATVTGIGGFFFRAKDPMALNKWYEEHFGIKPVPQSYDDMPWQTQAGVTVFAAFQDDTEYFGDQEKQWMMNFRVDDLDAVVKDLTAANVKVEVKEEEFPNGRFARVYDPEGNPVELWEPKS